MSESACPRTYRDYTGVSTRDLRKLILERVEDTDGLAACCNVSPRSLYRILNEETLFTNLTVADLVCCYFDLIVSDVLTVIPAPSFVSCMKMAADEFWSQEREATAEQIDERAHELAALRDRILGEPTEHQRRCMALSREHEARRNKAVRVARAAA